MRNTPSAATPELITTRAGLEDFCARIRAAGCFAFDTEFVMEDRYVPDVCVVQLAIGQAVAVVDAHEVDDLSPVWSLVADPDIEVIVHAGMEDMGLCQTQGNQTPSRVFDCQVAGGLVGPDYPLSLSRMVHSLLRVRIHKSQTLTDWRARPLAREQITYAAEDVIHLVAVHRILAKRLVELGRTQWMEEEMARYSQAKTYERSHVDKPLKLKGCGSMDGRQLAVARELVRAREELATRYDRPVRAVVRDHLLVEIARHMWVQVSQIKTLRGLNLRARDIRVLADAAGRGLDLPQDQWPIPVPPDDETDQEAVLALVALATIRAYCCQHKIAHQLVAAKRDVRDFVRAMVRDDPSRSSGRLGDGWRAETVGAVVRKLLRGEVTLGVRRNKSGPMLFVE